MSKFVIPIIPDAILKIYEGGELCGNIRYSKSWSHLKTLTLLKPDRSVQLHKTRKLETCRLQETQ